MCPIVFQIHPDVPPSSVRVGVHHVDQYVPHCIPNTPWCAAKFCESWCTSRGSVCAPLYSKYTLMCLQFLWELVNILWNYTCTVFFQTYPDGPPYSVCYKLKYVWRNSGESTFHSFAQSAIFATAVRSHFSIDNGPQSRGQYDKSRNTWLQV